MSNFEIALKEINDEWLASLPNPEDLPEPKLSKKYLRWERRVIRGKKPVANKVVKIILIAAALLIILSVAALSTDKGKEFILQFFKDSAVYSMGGNSDQLIKEFSAEYIPEGFKLVDSFELNAAIVQRYEKDGLWFEVKKFSKNATTDFSLESELTEIYYKDDIEYILSEDDGSYIIVVWNDAVYHYCINGTISKEEALKIAQSVS